MFLETIVSEGLAHLSYLIGDEGAHACAVIDPRRDVEVYLDLARRHEARIVAVLETHIHADFVSGSRELAAATGAPILVGGAGEYGFEHRPLRDGETLELGDVTLRAIHTPGHTPEHVCFLAAGGLGAGSPWGLFSGDTLFAGEVGRPDLLGPGTEEPLTRQLFRSLRERVLTLGDDVAVYPAHGKGSPCGARIGDRATTTIGYERRHNPRLRAADEDAFVRDVLGSAPPVPTYYPRMERVNAEGPPVTGGVPPSQAMAPPRFREAMAAPDTVVLDTREIEAFGGAHIEGALNIALRDPFPVWAGWMLDPGQRILLVLPRAEALDGVLRHLYRIGLGPPAGWLAGGITAWIEAGLPFRTTPLLSVHELRRRVEAGDDALRILDVRGPDEWAGGHVPGAEHIFLAELPDRLDRLDRKAPVATYCGTGYRASIAASLLERHGFERVLDVPGSMKAWRAAGYPLVGGGVERGEGDDGRATGARGSEDPGGAVGR